MLFSASIDWGTTRRTATVNVVDSDTPLIGGGLLQGYVLLVDFDKKRLIIKEPGIDEPSVPPETKKKKQKMILNWIKCAGDEWCDFFRLNLNHPHFDNLEGVYIIWHGAPNPAVVYVGQGNIRERILIHRGEPAITQYRSSELYVTWAPVVSTYRDGTERYLAEKWNPLVGRTYPQITPIQVNSPWP